MGKLAEIAGYEKNASYYKVCSRNENLMTAANPGQDIADTYITKWEEFATSRDGSHAKLAYDWYGSWTTIYNLYADAQLCFHLDGTDISPYPPSIEGQKPLKPHEPGFVPRHVYKKQSIWYHYVRQKYGLPLDSRHLYTKTDWEFFAMAVASEEVRSEILESVARWVNETVTDRPFTDLHNTEGEGEFPGPNFFARPVVGGHFAFLALQRACGGRAMEGLKFLDDHSTFSLGDLNSWAKSAASAAAEFVSDYHYGSKNGEL